MSHTRTPTYIVNMTIHGHHFTPVEWRVYSVGAAPAHGTPTNENLAKYVDAFEASTKDGGVNAHLGPMKVLNANIVKQVVTDETLATYKS